MIIDVVSHCWAGPNGQYAKLLAYQCQSLVDHPPEHCGVNQHIYFAMEDIATRLVLPAHRYPCPTVQFSFHPIEKLLLFQRPWGRNRHCQHTTADIVWWADADYLFGPGCLDALSQIDLSGDKLFYPRTTLICRDHATGDRYIERGAGEIDPADFIPKNEHKAIGGIQIVTGDTARTDGYVPHIARYQQPAPKGADTIVGFGADREYRIQLGTRGTPIDLPNLYRLRHSQTGDNRAKRLAQ